MVVLASVAEVGERGVKGDRGDGDVGTVEDESMFDGKAGRTVTGTGREVEPGILAGLLCWRWGFLGGSVIAGDDLRSLLGSEEASV